MVDIARKIVDVWEEDLASKTYLAPEWSFWKEYDRG
jgi:hypothetical protein